MENISKRKYATIGQLLSNSSKDTELLYTIQDLYIDDIIDLNVNETICRDILFGSDAVVCRVS